MSNNVLALELAPDEVAILIKSLTSYPIAMNDPLYRAAQNLYNKAAEGAKRKLEEDRANNAKG